MICGSIEMTKELKELMEAHGLKERSNSEPADFVIERDFGVLETVSYNMDAPT